MSDSLFDQLMELLNEPSSATPTEDIPIPIEVVSDSIAEARQVFRDMESRYPAVTTELIASLLRVKPLAEIAEQYKIAIDDLHEWRFFIAVCEAARGEHPLPSS